ncbi:MAG: hypothetical protein ACD_78C00025G0001 [uncultured bacterium (gcode 4)]|uniref:Uncharacterized protein n=1 Tax=uncultured bacterium (gcode 4) TaxID=1234023 RepID=K1YE30_9BACT|nr:MAG: hypothetical protein ACD_78C00025G0001 [uncultured bacterium (gcode 4)]
MSGTATEIQKTSEKTPEQIAGALDASAKNLEAEGKALEAKRKRGVAEKVRGLKTEVELQKLQSTLPIHEKKDIEEARKETNAVLATATAGVGLAVVAKTLSDTVDNSAIGKMGFKDAIKEWLTETLAEEADPKDGFFGKILQKIKILFLTPFAMVFGVDLKKKGKNWSEWESEEARKEAEKKKEEEKNKESQIDILKYKGTTQALIGFYSSKKEKAEKWKIQDVFLQKKFQELTFSQAEEYYESYKKDSNYSLVEKMWLSENFIKNKDIFSALQIITTGESRKLMEKKFSNKPENNGKSIWSETVYSLVGSLHQDVAHFAPMLNVSLENIQEIEQYVALGVNKREDGEYDITGPLKEKALGEMWLTKNILIYFWIQSNHKVLDTPEKLMGTIDWEKHWLKEAELKDIKEKIIPFAFAIQKEMASNSSLNLWVDFQSILWNNPLMFSEIIKIYIATGGKTNLASMNSFEQLALYTSMVGIAGSRDENMNEGTYSSKLWAEFLWQGNDIIPQWVKNLWSKIMESAGGILWESVKNTAGWVAGVGKDHPVAAAAILAYFVFWKWVPKRTTIGDFIKG